jgi:predicted site-specific integrase-resolvase
MTPQAIPPAFLRPADIARRGSVCRRTVSNWIRTGQLPVIRVGPRCTLVAVSDFDAFLMKFRVGGVGK